MAIETIEKLLEDHNFLSFKEIRSSQTGREKGNVYLCIIRDKFIYVGVTQNNLTQRILEHKRHPKTKFSRLLAECNDAEINWAIVEKHTSRDELSKAEKTWIARVGAFGTEHGLNETSGGTGTSEYTHSQESNAANSQRKKEYFADPKNRKKLSLANAEAHNLNPQIALEHSLNMKQKFNGAEGKIAREKVAIGMQNYLKETDNLESHSWDRGARPFVVVSKDGIQGFFLSLNECSRKLDMNSSHISSVLSGRRKSHKGNVFIYIKLGMTTYEILKIAEEKFAEID